MTACIFDSVKETKIKIKQGVLQGTLEKLFSGNNYASFKGIPYAKPPVGDLRFKGPQPPDNWSGIRDASKHGNACVQMSRNNAPLQFECSEDCLYLNVYTPYSSGSKLPVMVWFHGGAFLSGSSNYESYGPQHLLEEGVVIVTANYRLEAFGFLCLDTPDIPGNAGMKDQVAVLRWVRENIGNFGGDAENVTIFGQSAGGASVTYHIFSPMSKGLFHKVISQSGCCLNEWALSSDKTVCSKVAKILGIHAENPQELAKSLRSIPTNDLIGITMKLNSKEDRIRGYKICFNPTVEKIFEDQEAFLTENPLELLACGKYHKVPIIVGYCDKEGIFMTQNIEKKSENIFGSLNHRIPEAIRESLEPENLIKISEKIKNFYFGAKTNENDVLEALEDLETDVSFAYHITQFSKLLVRLNYDSVYFYRFCIDGKLNLYKINKNMGDRKGACHSDDVFYIFHNKIDVNEDAHESKTIKQICKMWTNFAKFSDPTPQLNDLVNVKWKPVTKSEMNYLNIDKELTQEINPSKERIEFWDEIYQKLNRIMTDIH